MPWNTPRWHGRVAAAALFATVLMPGHAQPRGDDPPMALKPLVDAAVRPVIKAHGIPGMAVGVIAGGKVRVFNYGVASKATGKPVTDRTLFEIGSVSKTFTATLASWARVNGRLSLTDKVSTYLPALKGTAFGDTRLLYLGTHTPGGMPLQVPDEIANEAKLMTWTARWKPSYPPGTMRTYSNVSIGMLGLITSKAMGGDFDALMEGRLFPALGLKDTFLNVPGGRTADYAQGYTKDDAPIRVAPGVLDAEAYGVKTTAADLLRFVQANMGLLKLDRDLQHAVMDTHTAYFRAGALTQDLIWEQYGWPVALDTLQDGNSSKMALDPIPAVAVIPPAPPRADVWINKTGSTNGFGAYVAFVPSRKLGIVILANKNYPNAARVALAHQILSRLGMRAPPGHECPGTWPSAAKAMNGLTL